MQSRKTYVMGSNARCCLVTFTLLRYGLEIITWFRPIAEMQHMLDDKMKALWIHDHNRRWMNEYMSQILQIVHRIVNALEG